MFTRTDKKATNRVFTGLVIYFTVMNLAVLLTDILSQAAGGLTAFLNGKETAVTDSGLIMMLAIAPALIITWLYFGLMQKKYGIFEESGIYDCDTGAYGIYDCEGRAYDAGYTDSECNAEAADRAEVTEKKLPEIIFEKKRKISFSIILFGLAFTVCCQVFSAVIGNLIECFFNSIGLSTAIDQAEFDVLGSIPLAVYITIIGPAAEEIVFRGFIMRGLMRCGRVFAIVASAFLFGIMHGNLQQFPFAFIVGILLGYAAAEYSVWCSMLMHIINNGGLSYALIALNVVLPDTVSGLILVFVFALSFVYLAVRLLKNRASLSAYISENRTKSGSSWALCNIWLLIFMAWHIFEMVLSLSPL